MSDIEMTPGQDELDLRFAELLATAIRRRGLSLEQIRRLLRSAGTPVSLATLSYWQRGRSLPSKESSLQAIAHLEEILLLPVGRLSSALPSDAFSRWDFLAALPMSDRDKALLERLGIAIHGPSITHYIHDRVSILDAGRTRLEETSEVMESTVDGLERTALLYGLNPTSPQAMAEGDQVPFVEAMWGCELGRVIPLEERGLMAIELILQTSVNRGEGYLRSYSLRWEDEPPCTESDIQRVGPGTVGMMVLEADFPERIPERVTYETSPYAYDPYNPPERLVQELAPGPQVQVCLVDAPAGTHLLRWTWGGHD
ncbi:hypothetical protein ACTQ49_08745 [Luteococcus sp. Sow4_B9]|uniref:hypothetical protein n=1 Tax=Luteococcus sp. Sow4_B9 TaxID=3438792 RepID=UPI003F9EA95C